MTTPLPWLGLGLSSNASARGSPHPFRLLGRAPGAFDYVEYSAPLDVEEARREASLLTDLEARRAEVPLLFHPVHLNLYGPVMEPAGALRLLDEHVAAVGAPWVSNDVAWWHAGGELFPGALYLPPPLTEAGLAAATAHVHHVQAGVRVPLLVENPAVFATRGPMHVLDFMRALHERTGAGLLLDVGHLYSHQLARGLPLLDGLDRFPLDRVVELHVAGGVVLSRDGRRFFADDHPQPIPEALLELLAAILPRATALRALTYEGDGHPIELAIDNLRHLRALLDGAGIDHERPAWTPTRSAIRPPLSDPSALADAWAVYDRALAGAGPTDDPLAESLEADQRCAVLAEKLDRALPLTRALLAGDRAGLGAFQASAELRSIYEGSGRSVLVGFSRWARRRVRELGDAALVRVVIVETQAWERARAVPTRLPPSRLAPGIQVVALPVDLSTLQHARTSLDRHLSGRARAGASYDASALAALHEVARRLPERLWPVVLTSVGSRVTMTGVSQAVVEALAAAARGDQMEGEAWTFAVREGWIAGGQSRSAAASTEPV